LGKSGVLEHKSGNISDKAHRAVIFAIAQLSCYVYVLTVCMCMRVWRACVGSCMD